MKLKYHGYFWPRQCENLRQWLFHFWTYEGPGVAELGIQVFGLYLIYQRGSDS